MMRCLWIFLIQVLTREFYRLRLEHWLKEEERCVWCKVCLVLQVLMFPVKLSVFKDAALFQ